MCGAVEVNKASLGGKEKRRLSGRSPDGRNALSNESSWEQSRAEKRLRAMNILSLLLSTDCQPSPNLFSTVILYSY